MITAEVMWKLLRKYLHGLQKRKRQIGLYLMILKKDMEVSVFYPTIMLFLTLKGINLDWTLRYIINARLLLLKDWGPMWSTTNGSFKGGQVHE